jgi:GTP-binding protein HflX
VPAPTERQSIKVAAERTVLAAVRLPDDRYDRADPFGELRELAAQAGAVIVGELEQRLDRPVAGTYMGTGKVQELKGLCEMVDAKSVIFDHELSPKQIAAIERTTERKVLDRSELILDIFASRATTHEAKLQVEIAQLEYTYPRLRAMWDHLERIVGSGGIGGVGTRGPGEQQLEIDRRLVQRRKKLLSDELAQIQARKRRQVQSRNAEHFAVGLVGYTNAGKSTLFNALTAGGAYADDRVFATLMTRTREWDLKSGDGQGGVTAMLSDTVGFVRALPHHLVASFRATLEEATHADLLLLVLDVADPAAELHYETVMTTLDELFDEVREAERKAREAAERGGGTIDLYEPPPVVLLLNKADLLEDQRECLLWQTRHPGAIAVCSLADRDGRLRIGHEELVTRVRREMDGEPREMRVCVPLRDAKTVHALESRGRVIDREYEGDGVTLRVEIGPKLVERLRISGGELRVVGEPTEAPPAAAWKPAPDSI